MRESWRAELAELIAIPSISAEAAHRDDVSRAAAWVCSFIRDMGGSAAITRVADEGQLVVGDIPASYDAATAPTVLCYGHFDVQPVAPLDLWESDPFELSVRDGWAYGRGVSDDKGQLYLLLKSAQQLAAADALPVNLRFVCDGEEEIGGRTIADWILADATNADVAVIFDGSMQSLDQPVFQLATRGFIAFDVRVRTGERDLHSGGFGGAALNAIHVLMKCLSAVLADDDGRLPEVLRKGARAPRPAELSAWTALPSGVEELEAQGARPLSPGVVDDFRVRTWAQPSADVNGILGGKPGVRNTSISAQAAGELSIRLAPGQELAEIGAAAEDLIRAAAPDAADVQVNWYGVPPGIIDPDARAIALGLRAFEEGFGRRPILTRSGGSLPIMSALAERGIATILTGFALPESNIHAPNERFLVRYFEQGSAAAQTLFRRLAELREGRP